MKVTRSLLTSLVLGGLLSAASLQAMACYTVYDSAHRVAYQGERSPVDMSLPLADALATRFPAGSSMVFDQSVSCSALVMNARQAPVRNPSALITDERTARAMNVPYSPAMGGLALVQPGEVTLRPGITVLPSDVYAQAPNTNAMGAGPAKR